MDAAQFITLVLAGLTVFLAVFAIVNEYRSNDVDRDDGPRCKQLARMGTMGAVVCGVLAFSVFGVSMLMRGPSQEIVATKPNASSAPQPAPVGSPAPSGGGAQSPAAQVPVATGPSPVIASAPVGPPPSFDTMAGSSQPSYAQGNSGASNYQWDSPSQNGTAARGDADDAAGKPADRRPKKVACPFTPVAYSVALRFSSEDASIHRFVDRVVRQAERDSGISISSSNDKLASLRITPNAEFVYADGKSSQLGASAAYSPRAGDKAASRYLFNPEISVTVTRENGSRASFSKRVAWTPKRDRGSDAVEMVIFPSRKRLVLYVTAYCQPLQGQFPEGAPSVFDLRGGTVAVQLVRGSDVNGPAPVDLDDVDKHGSDAVAEGAPRVRPMIVSILCNTSPAGTVELGIDDATIERSSQDRETIEVCGPVTLVGFPAEG